MKHVLTFFFLFLLNYGGAQPLSGEVSTNYTYRHFTIADGLPQIQITYLFCDSKGFVWVGTKFGLARWDGKQFKVFTPKEGAAGRQVVQVAETQEGDILVAWYGNSFNIIRGDVIQTVALPPHWNANAVAFLLPSAEKGKIFVSVNAFSDDKYLRQSVVAVYNLHTRRYEREVWLHKWMITDITPDGHILAIDYKPTGEIGPQFYLYHFNKLVDVQPTPERFTGFSYSSYPKASFFAGNFFSKLYEIDLSQKLIRFRPRSTGLSELLDIQHAQHAFFTGNNKCIYQNLQQEIVETTMQQSTVLAKLPLSNFKLFDKEGNLWIATENGLYCFYQRAMQEYKLNVQPGATDAVWSLAKTREGNFFYASYEHGFFESRADIKSWKRCTQVDKTAANDLMRKGAYGTLALQNGAVILAAAGGFYYLNKGVLKQYNLYGKGADMFAAWEDTKTHKVLISKYNWLFELDIATLKLDTVLKLPYKDLHSVLHITADSQGQPILSGAGTSLIRINNQWQPVPGAEQINAISSCMDSWNGLWLGHAQKLTLVRNGTAHVMQQFPGRQLVLSLTTWNRKWLVIGGGFEIIFLDLEEFYKTGKEYYRRFDAGSGFITTEGGQNSFLHDSDGSIWWPCSDKIIRFWPEKLLAQTTIINAPVIFSIKAINVNDSSIILTDTGNSGIFRVNKLFRNFWFEFGTAAMSNYDNLVYRYRLKEVDTNWSQPSAIADAVYNHLQPGTYTFQVQSSTDAVKWSTITSSSPITIMAWWYETVIFKLVIILFSITVVVFITRMLMLRKRKETERLKLMNELQLKAIRSKAIPHFSGNAFANIDYYIEKGDTGNASKYLAILSRLHNITLADSDRSARTLDEELVYLKLYLDMEKLRFEDRINYRFDIAEGVDKQVMVPNMILHTYAENAIKHGLKNKKGNGCITISIYRENNGTWLKVSDNGIGRKQSLLYNKESTKQGLAILNRQIELYNQSNHQKIKQLIDDLYTKDGISSGTTFSVYIPEGYSFNV